MSNKINQIALILIIFLNTGLLYSQSIKIHGQVLNTKNRPLPYVNVYLLNTTDGAMTNEKGKFSFVARSKRNIILIASMIGYEKYKKRIKLLNQEKVVNIQIFLKQKAVELPEAIVMGSSFSSEKGKGIVISAMDVLTTPGGAADIFQSLKTMPGLTQVSESAELYVRGGDPSETVTLIDQAAVYHPYTYESAYGGLFSNINTGAVKSIYFSSGGFSVKYGNALSGVLDIGTKNEPIINNYNLGISMAAASLNGALPIIEDKLGLRFYAKQSFTKPLMWLNGTLNKFTITPRSQSLNASLIYKYSQTGRLKLFGLFADDKQGINIKRAEYNGVFNGNSKNNLIDLQMSDLFFNNLIFKGSISFNKFTDKWKLGLLDLTKEDNVLQFRMDLEQIVSSKLDLRAGVVAERRKRTYLGVIPQENYNIRPGASADQINKKIIDSRIGAYAEIRINKPLDLSNLFVITGVRSDYIPELNTYWIDPRLGVGYKLASRSTIRLSLGIFHQIPDSRLFNKTDTGTKLKPMEAIHYVLSYNYKINEQNSFRVEAYYKDYKNLPLENETGNYNNKGFGFAKGVDMIIKGSFPFGLNGWISYGFINTKRKWMDYKNLTNSDFDITNNLSIVAKYNFSAKWQIGINFKLATGRPFTPVAGSIYHKNQKIYQPVYGLKNTDRYPTYRRLDLRLTYLTQLFNNYFTVFYVEGLNILNINNIFGYSYDRDYSQRYNIDSYFGRRTIVFGFQVNL